MGGILPRRTIASIPPGERGTERWRQAQSASTRKGLDDWRGQVVEALDSLIRQAAPKASGSIQWAQPVYEQEGPFAYIRAFERSVNFGC
jgi:hypothetical protein